MLGMGETKMATTHIHTMSGGYYFVIRNDDYVMLYSSDIYKTRNIARKKAKEYKKAKKL